MCTVASCIKKFKATSPDSHGAENPRYLIYECMHEKRFPFRISTSHHSLTLAAKSNHNELGIDQNEIPENSMDPLLSAQTIAEQSRAVARALPLLGNLRPDVLLPVVVQPQLVPGTAYTPPYHGAEPGSSDPVLGSFLRGR